ncbi:MAG: hypothetical protein ACI3T9_04420 [Romboutsia timonensis]
MRKTVNQWEIQFHIVARKLGIDTKDIMLRALMAANGKTFENMFLRMEDMVASKYRNIKLITYENNNMLVEENLFYELCGALFEVPAYNIKNILKED